MPRHSERPIFVPPGHWTMLPTICRLLEIGAYPEWVQGRLEINFKKFSFIAPPLTKATAIYLRDIFINDVYQLSGLDFRGLTVVDIGAYIGDSSIAFASKGAKVHAFEPSPELLEFLQINIKNNNFQDQVIIHPVGLSNNEKVVSRGKRLFHFVDALDYFQKHHIGPVDLLKLDCEGCEFDLLYNREFLKQLQPRRIVVEYHEGGGTDLSEWLADQGYDIDWPEPRGYVGYLYAERKTP